MNAVIEAFEAGEVDVAAFDHRAHVRVAWHFLDQRPLLEALSRFCQALDELVRAHGAEAKFNLTLSVAFMLLIRDRMYAGERWEEFASRESSFIGEGLAPVRGYYDAAQLERARLQFVLPAVS